MSPNILEMDNELWNHFRRFLCDHVELTHRLSLWNPSMKQSDESILELVKVLELRDVVLGVPICQFSVQG